MITIQDLIYNHCKCIDKPSRTHGGAWNDGSYYEIEVYLEMWYREHHKPPVKKDIKGLDIQFEFYDYETGDEMSLVGQIQDYKFLNDYKDSIKLMVKNCKAKEQ